MRFKLSFRVKLIGAFILAVLIAITVVHAVANYSTAKEFRLYLIRNDTMRAIALKNLLADYYRQNGSWQGAGQFLAGHRPLSSAELEMVKKRLLLVSPEGKIVMAPNNRLVGKQLPRALLNEGLPIDVGEKQVGSILAGPITDISDPLEKGFLSSVNHSILLGGLVATAIAVILGTLLFRQMTAPLKELTRATEKIARGNLKQRVRVRSKDELGKLGEAFNRMAASLERSEELRRNMIADISHELRTPLTIMRGDLEALLDGVYEPTQESISAIHEETLLLSRLVDDLHELSLAESGELHIEKGPTDLIKLIDRVTVNIKPKLEGRKIKLQVKIPPNLPQLTIDADRVEQVLFNLLSNAERYTPRGGKITLSVKERETEVQISVSNTGSGIAPEDLPHIFERFYRGDKSRSRASGGAGLGLAIAKQLVEAHGGRIWAESEPDQEAVFTFALPKIDAT